MRRQPGRPDDYRTLLQAAASARRAGQAASAEDYLNRAVQLRPES